jgi:extradiol dioxygenase family protein
LIISFKELQMSRVTEIRYVGYGIQDFDAERTFYAEDWGLVEVAAQDDFAWFKTHGHDEHNALELEEVDFETHQHKVHVPGPQVMDQWGIGVGGPQTMPHPKPDACLFQPADV